MPVFTRVVSPESHSIFPEGASHVQVVGGPVVLWQGDSAQVVTDENNDAIELQDGSFDVFAIHSARIVGCGPGELEADSGQTESVEPEDFDAETFLAGTAKEVAPKVKDHPDDLDAIEQAEKAGKNRATVLDAVDSAR